MKRNFRFLMTTAMAAALALAAPAFAHDGHDHGDEAPAASSNGPQRQPDGSVFLPKPSQRQIGVRTQLIKQEPLARSHELAGKVIMDPTTGGKVQAMVMGRLVPGPDGLPQIGQSVRKGQVLAYIEPASGVLERSGQMAQVAELRAGQALAQKRLARLRELSETVPRKEIEAAESEVNSLTERARALSGGLAGRDVLKAPVSGVIASSPAVAGQVVDARELVFEVVDPTQLRIEALAYDPAMAQNLAGAALAVGGQKVPLSFVGFPINNARAPSEVMIASTATNVCSSTPAASSTITRMWPLFGWNPWILSVSSELTPSANHSSEYSSMVLSRRPVPWRSLLLCTVRS